MQWSLSLPARGTLNVSYQAAVAPAGAAQARLRQWAKEFDALQVSLNLPKPVTIGVSSLSISPATLRLGQGGTAPLVLKGLLSNGQAAAQSLLAGATWATNNSAVAVVDTAHAVAAVNPGTAVITAQLGYRPGIRSSDGHRDVEPRSGRHQLHGTWRVVFSAPCRSISGVPSPPSGGGGSSPSPSTPSTPCTPTITAVGPFEATGTQTNVIDGSCFGTGNTTSAADTAYFEISDLTTGWAACWTSGGGADTVTCNISRWTDNYIIWSGYTGDYGQDGFVVNNGDIIEIQVWNPQSGDGPATCQVVVGSGSPTHCPGS